MRVLLKPVVNLSFLFLTLTSAAVAQDQPPQPFVIAETATIHSKILGEDRAIFVYDPDKNGANLLPSYPVLYMLDENDMTLVTGLVLDGNPEVMTLLKRLGGEAVFQADDVDYIRGLIPTADAELFAADHNIIDISLGEGAGPPQYYG